MNLKQKIIFGFLLILSLPLWGAIGANWYINWGFNEYIYAGVQNIPARPVALVLGTPKIFGSSPNLYYDYRLEAAKKLFDAGKVERLLLSGNDILNAHEAEDMKSDLIKMGVPESALVLDRAATRTLDSIVRAQSIFDQKNYIIVSQRFHCQRALFLAHAKGHSAIAFMTKEIALEDGGRRVLYREFGARLKAVLDMVFFKEPVFKDTLFPIGF